MALAGCGGLLATVGVTAALWGGETWSSSDGARYATSQERDAAASMALNGLMLSLIGGGTLYAAYRQDKQLPTSIRLPFDNDIGESVLPFEDKELVGFMYGGFVRAEDVPADR
ncbi:MAG: hypothetical protein WC498_01410 [Candidatus Saccharimonadales bacterium]